MGRRRAAAVTAYCAVAVLAWTVAAVFASWLEPPPGPQSEDNAGGLLILFLPVYMVGLWAAAVAASMLHALPAAVLGHALARRTGLSRYACCLVAEAVLAALYASAGPSIGLAYLWAWLPLAAAGAAPVLAASFYAGRRDPPGKRGWARQRQVARQISLIGLALLGVILVGGLLA
ncbi:hypothetical protein ACFWVC_09440 [Streptomyces sp. NPDC058691]|uniref:hypothetical protein n=1 Tax=Streptomyces sp. NPDC058691 TaxID=3346601 RepID=UPI003665366D